MQIPDAFQHAVRRREGRAGEEWLSALLDVVDSLMQRWSCISDGPLRHGQVALVVPVIGPHGTAVIKVSFPHEGNRHEAAALRHLDGQGAVHLLDDAPEHLALLLERADGPAPGAVLRAEESVEMMGDLARQLAVPAGAGLLPLAETAPGWLSQLEDQVRRAPGVLPRSMIDRARSGIQSVADDRTATVLHGDLHEANVLGAARQPWLAIDLKGLAGTTAYDSWTVAFTRPAELALTTDPGAVVRSRVRRFAAAAAVDPDWAAELAHARAVSSLLYETVSAPESAGRDLMARILHGEG